MNFVLHLKKCVTREKIEMMCVINAVEQQGYKFLHMGVRNELHCH